MTILSPPTALGGWATGHAQPRRCAWVAQAQADTHLQVQGSERGLLGSAWPDANTRPRQPGRAGQELMKPGALDPTPETPRAHARAPSAGAGPGRPCSFAPCWPAGVRCRVREASQSRAWQSRSRASHAARRGREALAPGTWPRNR